MHPQQFTYTTQKQNDIAISLYGFEHWGRRPCIIYTHGFKGFKDWGWGAYLGEKWVEAGYCFVAFNFSHNGVEGHSDAFTAFDKFEQNTFSLEVSELEEIIHLCTQTDFFGKYNDYHLGVLGHSRGGGITILAAADNPVVTAIATWASVCTLERYDKTTRNKWRKQGFLEVTNARTGQVFKMGLPILDDVVNNGKTTLNILDKVKTLKKPLHIIHGDADTSVSFYEAEQLNVYAYPNSTSYLLIGGADHTFGAKHPFEGATPYLEQALESTVRFFDKYLKTEKL